MNIAGSFCFVSADLQQIEFEHGNRVGEEFRQRTIRVGTQCCIQRVLKNVRDLARDFREQWETVASRCASQGMRGDVEPIEVLAARIGLLKVPEYSRRNCKLSELSCRNSSSDSGAFTACYLPEPGFARRLPSRVSDTSCNRQP